MAQAAEIAKLAQGVLVDLVGAAAHLDRDTPCHLARRDCSCHVDGPAPALSADRHEVVVLEQKCDNAALPVQLRHLLDDLLRVAQPSERASLCFVERTDAAEAAIPRTTAAAEDRRRR